MNPRPSKRRRLAQPDSAKIHTPPSPPQLEYTNVIQYADHASIVNRIISYLPRRQLLHLRLTSRAIRNHIDKVFRDHMVLNPPSSFHSIEGRHPKLAPTKNQPGLTCMVHGPKYCCDCCYATMKETYSRVVKTTTILDLRYLTNGSYEVIKAIFRGRRDTPLVAIRMWMWCHKPMPGRLLLKTDTLVLFGWTGSWEPNGGFRRERYELAPRDTPKVVFNLLVTNTKMPFTFSGLFVKRSPPASLQEVVFVFHSRWMSEVLPDTVEGMRGIIPRLVQLTMESRQPVRYTFVNAGAILEGTFPVPPPTSSPKLAVCANCTTFQDYARVAYTSAFGKKQYTQRVQFLSWDEYEAKVGNEQFRIETLG